jgi:CheY-like chemotaxis protein
MRKIVLVVDDDPLFIDLVRDVLAVHDIDILSAPQGIAALALLKTVFPSLIVSDFEMPQMNGIVFHSQLQQDNKTKEIPFVFMTGSSDIALTEYTKRHNIQLFTKNNLVTELLRLLDIS